MSYSNSFPTQRPTLNLDFANSGKLDSRISFSRADTPPTYAAPSAVHYWSNEKHLSTENLIPYSNLSSGFTFGRTTLASTNNSAPDGGSDAASILETADTATHEVYETFSCTSGQQYSFVFYLKANGRTKVVVKPQATSTIANVEFDLTAVTSTVNSGSVISHSVTAIGSTGWYKCAVTVTATATGTGYTQLNLLDGSGNESYTGDVTKGMFAWGASVASTGQTVVNQTSGQIHREFASTLKSVANAGDPRFEYDPATDGQSVGSGTALGLLVEGQATNYMPNSELDTGYSAIGVTTSTGACVGPTGTLAQVFTETTATGNHYIADALATNIDYSTAYTASVYAKKVASGTTDSRIKLRINGMGGNAYAGFDLVNGTVTQQAGPAIDSATISAVGNGWYRISMTWTNEAADRASGILVTFNNNTASSLADYVGDGFTSYALAGLQVEEGAAPSSLIQTNGSSVTRASDSCSVADFGYTGGPLTLVSDTATQVDENNRIIMNIDKDTSNRFYFYGKSANSRAAMLTSGGTNHYVEYSADANGKHAVRFDTNNYSVCVNGGTITDFVGNVSLPDVSGATMLIGDDANGGNSLNGHIKRVALYNVALSDTELQAITS